MFLVLFVRGLKSQKFQPLCKLRKGDELLIPFKYQLTVYNDSCVRNRHFNQWKVIDQSTKVISRKKMYQYSIINVNKTIKCSAMTHTWRINLSWK